jgi:pimeloyl-ACP methyl ester carboxylesterase
MKSNKFLYRFSISTFMLETTKIIKTDSFELAVYEKSSKDSDKLAIVLPGRLDTKDYPHMRSHVNFLASKGFLALSFDPPGTWESKGDISIYSTTNYLKAIQELILYYGNKPTLLLGHSRGGSMAIIGGVKIPQVYAFISIMGKASYPKTLYKNWKVGETKISTRDTPRFYSEKTKSFKLTYDFVKDSLKYNLKKELELCDKPKLFIAGKLDELVDVSMVTKDYDISKEPKELVIINSNHDYRKNESMIEKVNELIERFIEKL